MNFELDYIKELVKVLEESKLSEIAMEEGDRAIVLKKEKEVVTASVVAAPISVPAPAPVVSAAPVQEAQAPSEVKKGRAITSPMVGTFYKASSPGSKPFVEVGSTVSEGSTVCIIEAMKLMNEIESEVSGKVIEICVEDGQPVEFGQVLMYVE